MADKSDSTCGVDWRLTRLWCGLERGRRDSLASDLKSVDPLIQDSGIGNVRDNMLTFGASKNNPSTVLSSIAGELACSESLTSTIKGPGGKLDSFSTKER